jgi:hypothetical protein
MHLANKSKSRKSVRFRMKNAKHLLSVISVIITCGIVPILGASTAQADAANCKAYLQSKGYIVGKKVTIYCGKTDTGTISESQCTAGLIGLGVSGSHAVEACDRATWGSPGKP